MAYDRYRAETRKTILGMAVGLFWSLAAAAVVIALAIGAWQGGWFVANAANTKSYELHQKQTDQQAHLAQNNFGTQEGYITQITNDVSAVDSDLAEAQGAPNAAALRTAALGYANQACQLANLLTGSVTASSSMTSWISGNCSAGSVSLQSPIRNGSGN